MPRVVPLLFLVLIAPQDPAQDREALIEGLKSKFEALGPFRAEYLCGIPPHRTYRLVVQLDLKGRKALIEMQPVGKEAEKPPATRMYSDGFTSFVTDTEYLTVRRNLSGVLESLDRALYELRRLSTGKADGPEPKFPRILRPHFDLTIDERVEPHGKLNFWVGLTRSGAIGWLKDAAEAGEVEQDKEQRVWIFKQRGGRRLALDAENGLIRWLEIQMAGKTVRALELKDMMPLLPFPAPETIDSVEAALTGREITGAKSCREIVEDFSQAWSRLRKDPREKELLAVWHQFAAEVANLLEATDLRTQARTFIQRDCPEDGAWRPGSEELKAASARFVDSLEKDAEKIAGRRKARLDEWRASLVLALEAEEEEGGPPQKEVREFLKLGFDAGAVESRRGKLSQSHPAEMFRKEADLWVPVVHLMRGWESATKGNQDRAIAQVGIAIALWPRCTDAYLLRGHARARKGDLDGALEDFTRAIEISPFTRRAHYLRGVVWHQKDNLVRAIEDLTKALDQDPGDRTALSLRGQCLNRQKHFAGAIKDFTKALNLDPGNSRLLVWRGTAWWHSGDYGKSKADFTRAIETDPENAEAWYFRGSLQREHAKDKAISDLEKALELAPKDWAHREDAEKLLRELKK